MSAASSASVLLSDDVYCGRCEYNLRGLVVSEDAVCPECGWPIARSLRGDLVRAADPAWSGRLARGARVIFVGILVASVVGIVGQLISLGVHGNPLYVFRLMPTIAAHGLIVAACVPLLVGLWILTTPPPENDDASPLDARRLVRVLVPPAVILWPSWLWHQHNQPTWMLVVQVAADVLMIISLVVVFGYLRRLARRVADLKLARQTRWCMWAVLLAYLVACVFRDPWNDMIIHLPRQVASPVAGADFGLLKLLFRAAVEILLGIIGLAALWMLFLLAWYRDRLRGAAESAARRAGAAAAVGADAR